MMDERRTPTGWLIVAPSGRLDAPHGAGGGAGAGGPDHRRRTVGAIDLAGVDYLSSAGLRILLATLKLAQARGGQVALLGARGEREGGAGRLRLHLHLPAARGRARADVAPVAGTFRTRLLLTLAPALLAALALLGYGGYRQSRAALLRQIDREAQAVAQASVEDMDVLFHISRTVAQGVANAVASARVLTPGFLHEEQRRALEGMPPLFGITVAFAPGATPLGPFADYLHREGGGLRLRSLAGPDYGYQGWDWFREPLRRGTGTWAEPYLDTAARRVMITYAEPIRRDGKLLGVVAVDLTLDQLSGRLRELWSAGGGEAYLVSPGGKLVASTQVVHAEGGALDSLLRLVRHPGTDRMELTDPRSGRPAWILGAAPGRARGTVVAGAQRPHGDAPAAPAPAPEPDAAGRGRPGAPARARRPPALGLPQPARPAAAGADPPVCRGRVRDPHRRAVRHPGAPAAVRGHQPPGRLPPRPDGGRPGRHGPEGALPAGAGRGRRAAAGHAPQAVPPPARAGGPGGPPRLHAPGPGGGRGRVRLHPPPGRPPGAAGGGCLGQGGARRPLHGRDPPPGAHARRPGPRPRRGAPAGEPHPGGRGLGRHVRHPGLPRVRARRRHLHPGLRRAIPHPCWSSPASRPGSSGIPAPCPWERGPASATTP